jgi:hypothetical protein
MPVLLPLGRSIRPLWAPMRAPRAASRVSQTPPARPVVKSVPAWVSGLETVGQGIVYFTIFYCSMNWIYYRGTREAAETAQAAAAAAKKAKEEKQKAKK